MSVTISAVITTYNRPDKLHSLPSGHPSANEPSARNPHRHDGSSADYTVSKALVAKDPNMVWMEQVQSRGECARNNGVSRAEGTFIAFCDDDDYWLPITSSICKI